MKQTGLSCSLIVFGLFCAKAQDTFQLAPPFLKYPSAFFEKKATVSMQFAQPGTRIHYTVNGETPDETDPVYSRPVVVKKHFTTLKARVFGAGFLPSDVAEATFFKRGLPISTITHTPPEADYQGSGPSTLTDGLGGVINYDSPTWMGFQQSVVRVELTFAKAQKVATLLLHVLKNQGAWIFLPRRIEVFYQKPGLEEWIWMGTRVLDAAKKDAAATCQAILMPLGGKIKTARILVKIYPLAKIPDGHPGKGTPGWLFLDELNLY